ncbi:Transmembrane protein [Quillaja saponaria]|uniref:Transmembrane protein n=1 Tax=Quillaja saponaria TaxID=32244 RepID=A0AAD7PHP4_QUISA|nr:Transmembrane protein [Quillaja saponaria]
MEGFQKAIRKISIEPKSGSSTSSTSSFQSPNLSELSGGGGGGVSASLSSSEQPHILAIRTSGHVVSVWTCSKLCAFCFAAGVVFGFTLRRRVRRWASKLIKRLHDS